MAVSKTDLIEALKILTDAQKKAGGRKLLLLGGSALMILRGRRMTIDVDTYVADVDFITQYKTMEKLLSESCREREYGMSEVKFAQPGTFYFYLTSVTGSRFKVEVLSTIDKVVEVDEIISELGAFPYARINNIEVMCPTYESMFVMKLLSYDYHRPRDLTDLKWLSGHINKDRVISFCIDHGIMQKYKRVSGIGDGRKVPDKENSYPSLYKLALGLSDKTLGIALRRLHYPVPRNHEGRARLYARHYASKKTEKEELKEFKYYVAWKGRKRKGYRR